MNPLSAEHLELATDALKMICEGPADGSMVSLVWAQGVAMSALAAIEERTGYPKPCPIPGFGPYTMGLRLCDDDGIVRPGQLVDGEKVAYPCTGHAHRYGEHIECLSPAHQKAAA